MAGHASSERWIETDGARERGRGRSGDLSTLAVDPRFHESGRGGTVREKHGGPSGLADPARTTQTVSPPSSYSSFLCLWNRLIYSKRIDSSEMVCACAVDDRGSQRHPDCNIESSPILIPKSSPSDLSSGKDFRFECKMFPQNRRLLFDVNQGAVSHFVLILEVIHRCSVKILGLLFAGFEALCTQVTSPLRLSSMKKYVFGLGSVQCSHKLEGVGKNREGGEVSLPGGKTEEGDKDDGDTATREAKEEIGLDPKLGINVRVGVAVGDASVRGLLGGGEEGDRGTDRLERNGSYGFRLSGREI
ncbi:hypothetical protein DVH24_042710 [Malus domestica]|uniref:Uncharacterized protein n=1 Tax=Malus domestica TaxID=3750 RepID=A0A498I490_MALDO|nr:hypothetical protein DVH24_042710 [Malus domestica]